MFNLFTKKPKVGETWYQLMFRYPAIVTHVRDSTVSFTTLGLYCECSIKEFKRMYEKSNKTH